jgi:hypothetical protein
MTHYRFQPNGELPSHVKAALAAWPQSGSGTRLVHRHVLKVANYLRHYVTADQAAQIIAEGMPRRGKAGEIQAAIELAYGHSPARIAQEKPPRHQASVQMIEQIVAERFNGHSMLEELRAGSPYSVPDDTDLIVRRLFEPDSILCVARAPRSALSAPIDNFEQLSDYELIVPSPMSDFYALDEHGRKHARSLANTGPRRYIVTDFDIKPTDAHGNPTIYFDLFNRWQAAGVSLQDAQAALIMFLQELPGPLTMVVYSGNVSLQAWWFCEGESEELDAPLRGFFQSAVIVGADRAGWTKCQLFRMPGALRSNTGCRQQVHYFDPSTIK